MDSERGTCALRDEKEVDWQIEVGNGGREGGRHGDILGRGRLYKNMHERVEMPKEAERSRDRKKER